LKIKNIIVIAALFVTLFMAAGCGHVNTYGEKISNRNITAVKDILMHPQDYNDKTVTVKGKIALECDTGCWFNLKDDEYVIYVDLEPSGFAIPQNVGRIATAEGKILIKDGKPTLVAKGAEVQ
jgi:hypothetical protein